MDLWQGLITDFCDKKHEFLHVTSCTGPCTAGPRVLGPISSGSPASSSTDRASRTRCASPSPLLLYLLFPPPECPPPPLSAWRRMYSSFKTLQLPSFLFILPWPPPGAPGAGGARDHCLLLVPRTPCSYYAASEHCLSGCHTGCGPQRAWPRMGHWPVLHEWSINEWLHKWNRKKNPNVTGKYSESSWCQSDHRPSSSYLKK